MATATHGYAVGVLSSVYITAQSNTRNRDSLISCLLKISLDHLIFGSLAFTEFYFLKRISLLYKLLLPFLTFVNFKGLYRGIS